MAELKTTDSVKTKTITHLRVYLAKLTAEKDKLAISLFWEKCGVSSDYRIRQNILDNPGHLRVSNAIALAKFLSEHFSEVVTAESLSTRV